MTDYTGFTYVQLRDALLRVRREHARIGVEHRHVSIEIENLKAEIDRRAGLAEDLERAQADEVQKMKKKYKDNTE